MINKGSVLKKQTMHKKIHPVVFLLAISAVVLLRFSQIYDGVTHEQWTGSKESTYEILRVRRQGNGGAFDTLLPEESCDYVRIRNGSHRRKSVAFSLAGIDLFTVLLDGSLGAFELGAKDT